MKHLYTWEGSESSPRAYESVLRQAELSLLNLRKRIEELGREVQRDVEVESILVQGVQQELSPQN